MSDSDKLTPVPVTRGSENKILSQRIDWIAGTFKKGIKIVYPPILSQKFIPCKGYLNYTEGSQFDDGRKSYINPSHPEWGTHIVWSGSALQSCPIQPEALITSLFNAGFSFSRLDFAIDAYGFNLKPSDATEYIAKGEIKTRAKEYPLWKDAQQKGYTQYIGKKSSEIYTRIYDKAAEMGAQRDWTRVETVVRGKRTQLAAQQIVRDVDFRSIVNGHTNFITWPEWSEVMAAAPVKLPADRKTSKTLQWLVRTAAPSLAREMALSENPDELFLKFKDVVLQEYNELISGQVVH